MGWGDDEGWQPLWCLSSFVLAPPADPPMTNMVLVRVSVRLPQRGQSIDSFDKNSARNMQGHGSGGNIGVPWGRGGEVERQRTGTRESRTGSAKAGVKAHQIRSNQIKIKSCIISEVSCAVCKRVRERDRTKRRITKVSRSQEREVTNAESGHHACVV